MRARAGNIAAVAAATVALTACQDTDVTGQDPQAGGNGPDGEGSQRIERLSDSGGVVIDGSQVAFVYATGARYRFDVGTEVGKEADTVVKGPNGTLTLSSNGPSQWQAKDSTSASVINPDGSGTVVDTSGLITVMPDGSTTCLGANGVEVVNADGTQAKADESGAILLDADGGATTYGAPQEGQRQVGRYSACNVGQTVQMELDGDVLFEFDKADLTDDSTEVLDSAAQFIEKNAQTKTVKITGHTDSNGSDANNLELGRKRAEAVRDELAKQMPGQKFEVASEGERSPVAPNANPDGSDNPEGRAKNRRVTIEFPRS